MKNEFKMDQTLFEQRDRYRQLIKILVGEVDISSSYIKLHKIFRGVFINDSGF